MMAKWTLTMALLVGANPRVAGVSDAQLIAQSQATCDTYGIPRTSAPFDRCVRAEFAARRPG
jgi:hypothetical protein